jgi:hypothetical protein
VCRLSVVIPHLGNATLLENTLASVLANRPADCEVMAVLVQPYDDPYDVKQDVRFVAAQACKGPVAAVNLGIQVSRAPIVHVLWPGVEVTEGWAETALRHFQDNRVAAVTPAILRRDDPSRVAAAGIVYHVGGATFAVDQGEPASSLAARPKRVLAPHPAAAFYRRSSLDGIGGLRSAWSGQLACLDAALTFQQLGLWTVFEPRSRVTGPSPGAAREGAFREALQAEEFFWRWAPVLGPVRSLAAHGILLVGETVRRLFDLSAIPRLAGRLVGGCLGLLAGGNRRRIERLRRQFNAEPARPAAPDPRRRFRPRHEAALPRTTSAG